MSLICIEQLIRTFVVLWGKLIRAQAHLPAAFLAPPAPSTRIMRHSFIGTTHS